MKPTNTNDKQDARREVSPGGVNWIRLPKPGEHEINSGLARSVLTRLCIEGKVKSISLKDPGAKRGCRLVSLPSLLAFLATMEAEQNPEPVQK